MDRAYLIMSASNPTGSKHFFAIVAALAVLLLASGCGTTGDELAGTWEGESGPSRLVFAFEADGSAALSVTVGKETNTTKCSWERQERRIRITNPRGQVRSFGIIKQNGDDLVLRLDSGLGGLCHFRRR